MFCQIFIYFVVSDAICRLSTFTVDFIYSPFSNFLLATFLLPTLDFLLSTLDFYS